MRSTSRKSNVPPAADNDDENDQNENDQADGTSAESGDEEVLDELAIEPTPRTVSDTDAILEESTLPSDLPGQADKTDEDLGTLFGSTSRKHLADGFTGSGDEDGESISQNDADDTPDAPEHPAGA